ncbi:MAG: sugar ABC transporter ATP-binding protein [Christensenellaceae bacterium]|nr:sugar ABC transporter ATP-binding protein [Christensenellaceae bacterium]
MNNIILEMRNVTKRFPGVIALNNVNIELYKGEILGICGENGAGKSTLMKVLSGSYSSTEYEGSIFIDGNQVSFSNVHEAQNMGIEMVYQEMNMMLDATVAENLFVGNLPCKKGFVDYKKLYEDTEKLLNIVKLNIDPKTIVRFLNSGQMQLLSLMRAVVKNPKILVLDEPTTALTDQEVDVLMGILNDLRTKGVSCLYISHKLEELFRICDRCLVIRDGEKVNIHEMESVNKNTLIEEMVGRTVENMYPQKHNKIGEEVFRVESLSVPHPNLHGKKIVDNISLNLRKGEILGIGGLVGAGRSESLGAIFGQYTKGVTKKIFIDGKEVLIKSPEDAIANGIGFITEERKLNGIIWMLNIRENMAVANLKKLSDRFFMKFELEKQLVEEQIKTLRIKAPSTETKIVQLSGGNQQKVVLGKWLMSIPRILFVDEPTKGIDVGTKADFYQIMNDLTKQGVSIIMVSSDMPELIAMSDRVIVLSGGKITAELHKAKGEIDEKSIMAAAIGE